MESCNTNENSRRYAHPDASMKRFPKVSVRSAFCHCIS